jgi:hypothetical protein
MTHWPYILGISGRKQAGKDSTFLFLQRNGDRLFGSPVRPVVRVGFADDIKEICHHVLGLERGRLYGTDEDKETPCPVAFEYTYRDACKIIGEAFRQLDPECWTRRGMRHAKELRSRGNHVVITDVRRPAEVEAIREAGGKVLRLMHRGGVPDESPIERALDGFAGFDAVIDNRGCPEDTRNALVIETLLQWGWVKNF